MQRGRSWKLWVCSRRRQAGECFGTGPEGESGHCEDGGFRCVAAGVGVVEAEERKRRDMMEGQDNGGEYRECIGLEREWRSSEALRNKRQKEKQGEPSDGKPEIGKHNPESRGG